MTADSEYTCPEASVPALRLSVLHGWRLGDGGFGDWSNAERSDGVASDPERSEGVLLASGLRGYEVCAHAGWEGSAKNCECPSSPVA
jgi:hypothetical protein